MAGRDGGAEIFIGAVFAALILATEITQRSDEAPEPKADIVIIAARSARNPTPITAVQKLSRSSPMAVRLDDGLSDTDADSMLLTERFGTAPEDTTSAWRADRLRAQLGRISLGNVRFADIIVRCRRAVCQLAGSVTRGNAPADQAAVFALVHQQELVRVYATEGLEPGPVAIAANSAGEVKFLAYLVSA